MLKSGDYARCYAHFLWLCSHLRSFFIVHYAKKGYSAQCCAHVFCCFACSSLSGETSPKVATQMARDHARLPPDVDTPILYYHPSSDSACKGSKHALALLRQWNYPQKNPRTIIPPQEYGTPRTTMDRVCGNYRSQQTSPLFVTYDHTDIPPAPCMTRYDVAGWYIVTSMHSVTNPESQVRIRP